MFSFLLFSFSKSVDIEEIFEGEWKLIKIPENGNIKSPESKNLYEFAFSKQSDTDKIRGIIWRNDIPHTHSIKSFDSFITDKIDVEISDEKIVIKSVKNNIGKSLELDIAIEDELSLNGQWNDQQISIKFDSESYAKVLYGEDTYIFERDIPEAAIEPSDTFKRFSGQTSFWTQLFNNYSRIIQVVGITILTIILQFLFKIFLCNNRKQQKKGKESKKQQQKQQKQQQIEKENTEKKETKEEKESDEKDSKEEKDEGKVEEQE